jgi:hypothetical protein
MTHVLAEVQLTPQCSISDLRNHGIQSGLLAGWTLLPPRLNNGWPDEAAGEEKLVGGEETVWLDAVAPKNGGGCWTTSSGRRTAAGSKEVHVRAMWGYPRRGESGRCSLAKDRGKRRDRRGTGISISLSI